MKEKIREAVDSVRAEMLANTWRELRSEGAVGETAGGRGGSCGDMKILILVLLLYFHVIHLSLCK